MSISVSGSQITFNDASTQTTAATGFGFKNRIINGAMQIWQRGTSSGSAGYQTADRWYENASASTTFTQETSNVPTGFQNAFKMTAGATAQMWLQQPIETKNCYDLVGQTVTVSVYMAASTTLNANIVLTYSTSADNPASGSWSTVSGTTTVSVTSTYAKFSATFTVPSNALTIMPQFITSSTVSAGTILYITGVQLEKGSTATSFDYRPYGTELQLCQRYYWRNTTTTSGYVHIGMGMARSTTGADIQVKYPVPMRTTPSAVDFSSVALADSVNVFTITSLSINDTQSGQYTANIQTSGSTGLTQYRPYFLVNNNNSTGYLGLSAEL